MRFAHVSMRLRATFNGAETAPSAINQTSVEWSTVTPGPMVDDKVTFRR